MVLCVCLYSLRCVPRGGSPAHSFYYLQSQDERISLCSPNVDDGIDDVDGVIDDDDDASDDDDVIVDDDDAVDDVVDDGVDDDVDDDDYHIISSFAKIPARVHIL